MANCELNNKITLVGMSNIGKSFWSKELEREIGYFRFSSDEWIEERLTSELQGIGYSGIKAVSEWMGQP